MNMSPGEHRQLIQSLCLWLRPVENAADGSMTMCWVVRSVSQSQVPLISSGYWQACGPPCLSILTYKAGEQGQTVSAILLV